MIGFSKGGEVPGERRDEEGGASGRKRARGKRKYV